MFRHSRHKEFQVASAFNDAGPLTFTLVLLTLLHQLYRSRSRLFGVTSGMCQGHRPNGHTASSSQTQMYGQLRYPLPSGSRSIPPAQRLAILGWTSITFQVDLQSSASSYTEGKRGLCPRCRVLGRRVQGQDIPWYRATVASGCHMAMY